MSEALTNFRLCEMGLGAPAAAQGVVARRQVRFCDRDGNAWPWLVAFGLRGVAYAGWALVTVVFGGAFQKFFCFDF